jgi:hypothetical protein
MRSVAIGMTALTLLAGCASSASDGWTKAGASEQQIGRDTADCLAGAQIVTSGPQGPRTTIQQDRYRRCMVERGYAETPRK